MFIEDTGAFFAGLSKVIRGGLRQMGWYKPSTQRMRNTLTPQEMESALRVSGWTAELEYLDWYKSGYFLRADKGK